MSVIDAMTCGPEDERAVFDPSAYPAVFVNWIDKLEDLWEAVWEDGAGGYRSVSGSRQEVIDWARAQPAKFYWIYDGSEFVPLMLQS